MYTKVRHIIKAEKGTGENIRKTDSIPRGEKILIKKMKKINKEKNSKKERHVGKIETEAVSCVSIFTLTPNG